MLNTEASSEDVAEGEEVLIRDEIDEEVDPSRWPLTLASL